MDAPFGFGNRHSSDLSDWDGSVSHTGATKFFDDVSRYLGLSKNTCEEDLMDIPPEGADTKTLRSEPMTLSKHEVKTMLIEKDFFDKDWYPSGVGFINDFKVQEDGKVVFDHASGLMWQQSGSHTRHKNFEEVNAYIRQLNSKSFAGYSNWRIPTLEEAMSFIDPAGNNEKLYIDQVFDKEQIRIWTCDKKLGLFTL